MMNFTFIIIAILLSVVSSSAATITAASTSRTDVNTAINTTAARGDTVVIPSGSSTWSSGITISKGVLVQGAGIGSTVITASGGIAPFTVNPDATALANDETISITGIEMDGAGSSRNLVTGNLGNVTKAFKNLVIGSCKLRRCANQTVSGGAIFLSGQFRGCIYSNIIADCNMSVQLLGNDLASEWTSGNFPLSFGTADNLYFEGNRIIWEAAAGSFSDPGWFMIQQCARAVIRYNSWEYSHSAAAGLLFDFHGAQYFPGGQYGSHVIEFYGNSITGWNGYGFTEHRGGWGLYYNNIFTGSSGGTDINMSQYDHGCVADTGAPSEEIANTYIWNNTLNGTALSAGLNLGVTGAPNCGLAENSNFRNYNSSFNGSVGIGRGTTTPGGSATTGVGYWKATTATPTTNSTIIQAGTFYKATAPNTYTAYYTPYTYPHPLQNASGGGATPGTLALTSSAQTVSENVGSVQFTVSRSGGSSGTVGISYATGNGTATAPGDYTTTSGTLTWANGDTANKTITIPIIDDSTVESTESFSLILSSPTGGATLGSPSTATITITDNDTLPPAISVSPSTSQTFTDTDVNQSRTLTFTVSNTGGGTLSGSVSGLSAPFSIVSGSPYNIGGGGNQVVTIRFSPTTVGTSTQTATFGGGAVTTRDVTGTGLAVNSTVLSGVAVAGAVSFNP